MASVRVEKREGNFFVAQKEVVECPLLSWQAKGLWSYAMSRPNHWQFKVEHLATISRNKIKSTYSCLHELIKVGYCILTQTKNLDGKWGPVDYVIFETLELGVKYKEKQEELKKFLPLCQNGKAQKRELVSGATPIGSKDLLLVKEKIIEKDGPSISLVPETSKPSAETPSEKISDAPKTIQLAPGLPKVAPPSEKVPEVPKNETTVVAVALAFSIMGKIKEVNPDFSKSSITPWIKDCSKLLKIRELKRILYVLEYALQDKFWCSKVLSPDKLLKHLDALEMQITQKQGDSWKYQTRSKDSKATSSDNDMRGQPFPQLGSILNMEEWR